MIREIKSYSWGTDENPIKKNDHAMDELRYYIMSKTDVEQDKNQMSETLKYKHRLISNLKQKRQGMYG